MSTDPIFAAMALGVWIAMAALLLKPMLSVRHIIFRRVLGGLATFVAGCSYSLVRMLLGFVFPWFPYVLYERPISLLAAAIAAACWSWEGVFLAGGCGGHDGTKPLGVCRTLETRRARAVVALFFCIGCLRPFAMMWCLPHVAPGVLWGTQITSNPIASLGLVASMIGSGVWIVRTAQPGGEGSAEVSQRFGCALLGSYAAGEVACYAVSRSIRLNGPYGEVVSYALCFLLVAMLAASMLLVWRHIGQETEAGGEDASSSVVVTDNSRQERLIAAFGLTDREASCLILAIDGMTSTAIAEHLGIKAPTVRAYQQRSYRKMEVASLVEARELVARQADADALSPPDAAASNASDTSRRFNSGRFHAVLRVARASFAGALSFAVASLALPTALDWSWGAGDAALRIGIMALCFAAVWAFSHVDADKHDAAAPHSKSGQPFPHEGRIVSDEVFEPFGLHERAIVWGVLLEIAFASMFPSFLSAAFIVAIALCATSAFIFWACRRVAGEVTALDTPAVPATSMVTLDTLHIAYLALLSFVIGVAWEEVWRSATTLSFAPLMTPLFGYIIVVCVWALRSQGVRATRYLLFATLVVVVAAKSGQAAVALFGTSMLAIYLLASSMRNTVRMPVRALPLCTLCGVAGILGGGKVTNVYADLSYAQFRDVALGGYASMGDVVPASGMGDVRTAILVAIVTCLTLLMLLTAWACMRLFIDVRNERDAAALIASRGTDRARLESYLVGRGLNAVQTEVALRIVAGETGPQIAREMCYSLGAVNSARDAAYRLLRVHRRAQLIALLRRDAGL